MSVAKELILPWSKLTSYSIGIMKVTQFGVLKDVEHDDHGWVTIRNEDNQTVQMKKIYAGWLGVYLKAQKLIGKPIVYETGGSASAGDYFRDIHEDSPNKPMLTFPDGTSDEAKLEIILARLSSSQWKWEHDKAQDSLTERLEQIEEQKARMQQLEKQEYDEVQQRIKDLDQDWSDWEANPERKLRLQGAANHGGRIQGVDRKFKMRLNIDTSEMRAMPVRIVGRGENNYVRVKLPKYDNLECEVGVARSTQRGSKDQWSIVTVRNQYDGWYKLEQKMYPNAKTYNWGLDQCGEAHDQIISKLLEKEQIKLDLVMDQFGDIKVITA